MPKSVKDQINWLRLTRSRRVGPATFVRLLNEYESVDAALDALPNIARDAGVSKYTTCGYSVAEREFDAGRHLGFTPLFLGHPDYPTLLNEAPDAPPFLWAQGNIALGRRDVVGMVGARNASSLGRRIAGNIARELGEAGVCVASGLARGIDAAAHGASLATGTIAVQAGGLDVIYPKENEALTDDIAKMGLRLSEQPIGLIPQARHFPQRNRIIAGVSSAIVVVEGAARSGSLITARIAAELGREVMAVPGNPMDGRATGCNILIREGATLIRSGADILESLNRPAQSQMAFAEPPAPEIPRLSARQIADRILNLLGPSAVSEDDVIRDTGLPTNSVSPQITALEIKGDISRHPGGKLARKA
ncbi:DNA protecting protein DprA [Amylibacter kogurei]|uniref:DNA protecting protein DprA n=1 Tax=Paramylibacter kogurei TaxID=1889778 RepID=A0A2G5K568_9RHOB|nr:DNA-processing protein DprA [Amylibacter kogurei]PIB24163.1 DNA protecting protein DprA [Amylibacter kogurei]